MAQFYPLRVAEIKRDTKDSVILTLEAPEDASSEFQFIQGQYLTFRRVFDGEEMRRSYSICAGVNDGELRVGIKRVDGGWFSTFANEELNIGDTLEAMKPMGNFHAPLKPAEGRAYLGFAGGSGITPMISLIKTVLEAEPKSTFTLAYGNRSTTAIMFREELEDLKNIYMGRLNIVHVLESEAAEIELFSGRLDREKCDQLFSRWIDVKGADLAFICGPEPMMLAVSDALKAHGMAENAIKFELFSSAQPGKARKRKVSAEAAAGDAKCSATIIMDGAARQFDMKKETQTVLDAARAQNIDAPFACKAGVCSTCRAKLIEGEVDMEANYALEDYEVERGYILTCQSYPRTDKVVVDYDQ
ncbi:phenylacetate-CoA oxygenase/reductase subunit PaaK [Hyphococcus flavus]|uniref:Phenylacetate-CoA oxygenase/reductase subunit PaaK n=1 Tax=Hyphococcus flavus TaxID=1866326 RepID=A0AAF0CGH8_9PROT|nr:1,2-phenylacetyl-CoA epoxidase subunit PaaE [Hyphococcus flavus]WDI30687.1 phenylacetate-CoA oxygenase/reductase subunit PaaK [Hyphococcus flavus]